MARRSSGVYSTSGSRPSSAISSPPRIASALPLVGEIDVDPSGEQVQRVPFALAVAQQDQRRVSPWSRASRGRSRSSSSSIRCSNARRFFSDSPRATRHCPLFLDRRPETQLQQRVEVGVDGLEHLAEHPVDLVGGHRVQRHPADKVDVADVVERCRRRRRACGCVSAGTGRHPRGSRRACGRRTPRRARRCSPMDRMVLVLSLRSPGSSTMRPGSPPCAPSWRLYARSCALQRVLDDC